MTSKITYLGDLRCESEHLQSGTRVFTDAPTDNHGKGEVFSPTDLCATSLAQCMLTTIAILGKDKGINIEGSYAELQKIMNPKPRKIAEIVCDLYFHGSFSDEEKAFIENTAMNCPVALTLSPEVKKSVTFNYPDQPL
ncbi:OsmC family protein [Chryseobacterium sp. VAUSW3]|uniref:OsmC family protein n=1 Tax=Chryseobacterium sp. VAUSW3 TaxID=2010998 RepID=UPI000B4C9391|nr:OsmC family protein [Chryseobacterium sp. VAUSW3]OWR15421.1 osmotically inducible protein OsmC [Chryseobacterium sp. VAUSW3]